MSSKNDSFSFSEDRCIAAYTTLDRVCGRCGVIILWEKVFPQKELEIHTFFLSFDAEGIKRYTLTKLFSLQSQNWENYLDGYVRIDFLEAVSLVQDAYQQNIRFGTNPAKGWETYRFFLDYDIPEIDRGAFLQKLALNNLNPIEFTNVYLSALKRLDNALLYDLSSPERQKALGPRQQYLLYNATGFAEYTFLRSKVLEWEKQGKKQIISAAVIVSTPEDEIMKISYRIELVRHGQTLNLENIQELARTILPADDPENPLNYQVFCSIYKLSHQALVKSWLESNSEIFLTGEFTGGTCYKLLRPEEVPSKSFDAISGIICEFMLTENELFIYAQKPFHLAKMERSLPLALKDKAIFKHKFYLPVRKLYKAAIMGLPLEDVLKKSIKGIGKHTFLANSAFLYWKGYGRIFDKIKKDALHILQLDRDAWYFFIERKMKRDESLPCYVEYYISGNWIRINVFNGGVSEELNKLGPYIDVIKEYEFSKRSDIFSTFSRERQWKMYKMLKLMGREAPSLKAMGLIPSVKGMARRLGTLVQ